MKRYITTRHRHASSVRPDPSETIFTHTRRSVSPSLLPHRVLCNDFHQFHATTTSGKRGADHYTVFIVGIVVIPVGYVVVDIIEIVVIVIGSGPQPPPGRLGNV